MKNALNPPFFFIFLNLILLTIFTSTGFVKASSTEITFSPAKVLVKEDSNFTIQVQILNSPPFTMFWITINYNTTVLDALNANVTPPWENPYINIDENQGKIDISSTTQQPLEGNQTIATITFKAILNSNSTLQFTDTQIYDPQLDPIPHTTKNAQIEIVGPLNITVASVKDLYYLEQNVTIYGNLTVETTPVNSLIGVEVTSPKNTTVMTRIIFSSTPTNTSYPLEILSFYPSDEHGNPLNSFNAGSQAYFTITVKNLENGNLPLLIVITVFDRYNTPIGFTIWQGTIFSSSSLMYIGPIFIKEEAFNGTAAAYANLFSNWPKNQGIPYCPEKSVEFQVMNGVTKSPVTLPSTNPAFEAQYNLTFRLPLYTGMGNYTIYTTSHYKVQNAYAASTFLAKLICDFNEDGKIGPYDFALFSLTYGSTPEDPDWLPEADFDNNQKIGPYDFAILALNYGKHV